MKRESSQKVKFDACRASPSAGKYRKVACHRIHVYMTDIINSEPIIYYKYLLLSLKDVKRSAMRIACIPESWKELPVIGIRALS